MIYEKKAGARRYTPRPDLAALEHLDLHSLIVGATRFYLGRMTIQANMFARYQLIDAWPHLDEGTKHTLQRDIEREFEADDAARARGDYFLPMGMDCDREAWDKVRQQWRGKPDTSPAKAPVKPRELARMIRLLSESMREVAEAMGDNNPICPHALELAGAAKITKTWADVILEMENENG